MVFMHGRWSAFFFHGVLRPQKPQGLLGTGKGRDRVRQSTYFFHGALRSQKPQGLLGTGKGVGWGRVRMNLLCSAQLLKQ